MSTTAFFTLDPGGAYVPTRYARSAWSDTMLNGPAAVAAAARSLELHHGADGFQPARLTVDLFAPVALAPLTVTTEAVREGNRIRVADARVVQGGATVARATLVQLRRGEQPPGEVWRSGRAPEVPAAAEAEPLVAGSRPYFGSDTAPEPWSTDMGAQQGPGRKRFWHHPLDVVDVEPATPFQRAAMLAESTSLMTHWGSEGIGFINADLTVTLARLPRSGDLGLEADEHLSDAGVAVGTATLYDRDGVFGAGTVVAVSNAGRQIDFAARRAGGGSMRTSDEGTRA
ncbi:MAG TPA: thioesterase family protein [Actinomycetales bacterium]|nr:thioesterase family protein [Actinomycetales bacterium]